METQELRHENLPVSCHGHALALHDSVAQHYSFSGHDVSRAGRVCQVVEKSERVIIPVMIATYYAARFTDPISFQPSIFRSFT